MISKKGFTTFSGVQKLEWSFSIEEETAGIDSRNLKSTAAELPSPWQLNAFIGGKFSLIGKFGK